MWTHQERSSVRVRPSICNDLEGLIVYYPRIEMGRISPFCVVERDKTFENIYKVSFDEAKCELLGCMWVMCMMKIRIE